MVNIRRSKHQFCDTKHDRATYSHLALLAADTQSCYALVAVVCECFPRPSSQHSYFLFTIYASVYICLHHVRRKPSKK